MKADKRKASSQNTPKPASTVKLKDKHRAERLKETEMSWMYFIPIMFILAIVPLIVHLKAVPLTGDRYMYWIGVKENPDFFSYYKGLWLMISTLAAAAIFAIKLNQSNFKLLRTELWTYYAAAGLYVLFVIASTSFSKYSEVATWGFTDRYEGMFILLSYVVIFLITANQVRNQKHVKTLLKALYFGAVVIGIIGLFQYLGYDFWKTSIGKSILLPSQFMKNADALDFRFGENFIYATLYHPNYVGSYTAMLFPLSFSLFILSKDKYLKMTMGLMTLLMGVTWVGSNSRAGMIGVSLALVALLISINKIIIRYWKYFAAGFVLVALIALGFNQLSNGYVARQITTLSADAVSLITGKAVAQEERNLPLKEISISGQTASVTTPTEKLSFSYADRKLTFFNTSGAPINATYDSSNGKMNITDPAYKDYNLTAGKKGNQTILQVEKGIIKLVFDLKDNGIALIDNKGREVDLKPVATWGFEGKEKLGSARGYIWSRSIPLLKNTMLLGYGPDTFAIVFPQNDFMGKMYAYDGDMWQIVDKPHNLYLQIALNTGLISLLGFLALIGLYMVQSLRIYVRSTFPDFLSQAGVSVFAAIMGYLGAAFFNDSIISVAPVFWVLLGLGVSINHLVRGQQAEKAAQAGQVDTYLVKDGLLIKQ